MVKSEAKSIDQNSQDQDHQQQFFYQSSSEAYLQQKLSEKEREVNQLGFENSELKRKAHEYRQFEKKNNRYFNFF